MARGSQFRRAPVRAPSQRRKVTWGASAPQAAYVTLALGTKVLHSTLDPKLLANVVAQESTIVRTRGVISIRSDQAAVVEDQVGAMGMMFVTDEAVAAGVASIPGPVTNADNDGWFVWVPFAQRGADVGTMLTSVEYQFDSKAMRKFEAGTTLVTVVENASSLNGLAFYLNFRQLFKLA